MLSRIKHFLYQHAPCNDRDIRSNLFDLFGNFLDVIHEDEIRGDTDGKGVFSDKIRNIACGVILYDHRFKTVP